MAMTGAFLGIALCAPDAAGRLGAGLRHRVPVYPDHRAKDSAGYQLPSAPSWGLPLLCVRSPAWQVIDWYAGLYRRPRRPIARVYPETCPLSAPS